MATGEADATDEAAMQTRITELEHQLSAATKEATKTAEFHGIANNLRDAISIFADGRRLFVNQAFLRMFAYESLQQALSEPLFSRLRPGDRERLRGHDTALDEWSRWQSWLALPDGGHRLIETVYSKISYHGATAWCAVMRDLNEDKETAIALRDSEERFRVVFESSPIGIALKDSNNRIITANPAMQALFGRSDKELAGTPFRDYWAPGFSTRHRYQKLVSGEVDDLEVHGQYVRPNGDLVWARGIQTTVNDESGNFMYVIQAFEDITELKEAEATRQQLIWRLVDSKEEQSRHIARELHDEIGQELTGLKMQIEARTPDTLEAATQTVHRRHATDPLHDARSPSRRTR